MFVDTVKIQVRKKPEDEDEPANVRLEKEKQRLERTIASLIKRLEEVKKELKTADN